MKTIFRNMILGAVALFALASIQPAFAASMMLCAPDVASGAKGPRVVQNPNTSTSYSLNSVGCAIVAQADIGYFLSQGYSAPSSEGKIIYTTGVQTGTTNLAIGSIPAGAYIKYVIYQNLTANAVTGGISIGTTANGTDVVAAQTVGASALTFTDDSSLLKRPFSTTAATTLNAAAVTAWNSANVTITVVYDYF